MSKTDKSFRIDAVKKAEVLENEDRKLIKHKRQQFAAFLDTDEDFQDFKPAIDADISIDNETLTKYLRK